MVLIFKQDVNKCYIYRGTTFYILPRLVDEEEKYQAFSTLTPDQWAALLKRLQLGLTKFKVIVDECNNVKVYEVLNQCGSVGSSGYFGLYGPAGSIGSYCSIGSNGSCGSYGSTGTMLNISPSVSFGHDQKKLSPNEVYGIVLGWKLTSDQRNANGYPGLGGFTGIGGQLVAVVPMTVYNIGETMWIEDREKYRKCCRCSKRFQVLENGDFPQGNQICKFKSKIGNENRTANCHVTGQRFVSELKKYVTAPFPNGKNDARSKMIYALDTELVWTTAGPALARTSLVNIRGELVLDIFVMPPNKIVDYCTEHSGITQEMLIGVTTSLEEARQQLFQFINSETILVGHSLESDLKAIRLIHWNTVDTALIYSDNFGNKVALRTLSKTILRRAIQGDNIGQQGHSSPEDALACIDLIKHKLNSKH